MYFVVTLALKILIYAQVNSAFSGFASLKLHLFIHSLRLWRLAKLLFSQPLVLVLGGALYAVNLYALDAYALEEFDAVVVAIWVGIDNALYSRLDDELCALYAGRSRNI